MHRLADLNIAFEKWPYFQICQLILCIYRFNQKFQHYKVKLKRPMHIITLAWRSSLVFMLYSSIAYWSSQFFTFAF